MAAVRHTACFTLEGLRPGSYSIAVKYVAVDSSMYLARDIRVRAGHTAFVSFPIYWSDLAVSLGGGRKGWALCDTFPVRARTHQVPGPLLGRHGTLRGRLIDTLNNESTRNDRHRMVKMTPLPDPDPALFGAPVTRTSSAPTTKTAPRAYFFFYFGFFSGRVLDIGSLVIGSLVISYWVISH